MHHIFFFIIALLLPVTGYTTHKITATINPIHSLVSAVSYGITKPALLIQNATQIHNYILKPSDILKINSSDIIFYIDDKLEHFIPKIKNKILIKLSSCVPLLPVRNVPHVSNYNKDLHIWLSPSNAKKIVKRICDVLTEYDPQNAFTYANNTSIVLSKIDQLSHNINNILRNVKDLPYVTTHDAYQYFEKYFELNFAGSLSPSDSTNISAKTLSNITKTIIKHNIKCIFTESQTSKNKYKILSKHASIQILDLLGNNKYQGKDAYFKMMHNLAITFKQCFLKNSNNRI
ncbi:metal ABC transporter substrate-binding protein [Candidatus Neoehrlichia procyonis]|uniref:High-affinity zinc uptake system protein ZnuA n=1 Tax=Candidatus Neoehrlichia procyonis str. RAC413 TaxID=1359163 RepID=A0A0F3NLT6_9RICK|nr:metal ABC transporter substrate-binding protein [Candidatus Neoehrlichia lotoris]KJV68652.1 periplasmic solute binding family protein [Candidatus Neoehrlichia lotoris str. RAC413]